MRRIVSSVLLFCMVAMLPLSAADSIEMLTYEERQQYIANALTIQTEQHTVVTGGAYDWGRPGGLISSWAEGSTTTEWYPYLGAREISKEEFYRLTGQDDLLAEEIRVNQFNRSMSIAGWTIYGVGMATMLSAFFFLDNAQVGYGLMGIGALVGCCILSMASNNDASSSGGTIGGYV